MKRVVCLLAAAVLSGAVLAGCTGKVPGGASFQAGGLTVYATYRHPPSGSPPVSAALLIAGSGPTDRDGNDRQYPYMDTLRTVAGWLSDDGVASLRYDKLGTGRTGAGPYAGQPAAIGVDVFEQQAAGALTFLAAQPGVRRDRLTVAGHSEGALYALLLATGAAGPVPPIHALALLEPLSRRLLDTIAQQIDERLTAQQQAGQITPEQAQQIRDAMSSPNCVPPVPSRRTCPAACPRCCHPSEPSTSARSTGSTPPTSSHSYRYAPRSFCRAVTPTSRSAAPTSTGSSPPRRSHRSTPIRSASPASITSSRKTPAAASTTTNPYRSPTPSNRHCAPS